VVGVLCCGWVAPSRGAPMATIRARSVSLASSLITCITEEGESHTVGEQRRQVCDCTRRVSSFTSSNDGFVDGAFTSAGGGGAIPHA